MFFIRQKSSPIHKMTMAQAKEALAGDPTICLIDVRTPQEYNEGHIPGSVNLPLGSMDGISSHAPEPDTKLFVYCLSGGRSARACGQLASMGYSDITDLGGIMAWPGPIERKGRA